jgi:hypothetical protein
MMRPSLVLKVRAMQFKKPYMTNSRMASSKELGDYHVFDLDGFGDETGFLHPDVDSQFVCLLTVTGSNGDCLTVNEQGLDSFLSCLEEDTVPGSNSCLHRNGFSVQLQSHK